MQHDILLLNRLKYCYKNTQKSCDRQF